MDNYYIDYKDGIFKSNKDNNEFRCCKSAREFCKNWISNYYLEENLKCKECVESFNGRGGRIDESNNREEEDSKTSEEDNNN